MVLVACTVGAWSGSWTCEIRALHSEVQCILVNGHMGYLPSPLPISPGGRTEMTENFTFVQLQRQVVKASSDCIENKSYNLPSIRRSFYCFFFTLVKQTPGFSTVLGAVRSCIYRQAQGQIQCCRMN